MGFPRILLGAALLMLSVRLLPALDVSVEAYERNHHPVVSCMVMDMDAGELIRFMDEGGTPRLTWHFRLGESDVSVTRYAHRDSLGEGYLVYGDAPGTAVGPLDAAGLIGELSRLTDYPLPGLGDWKPEEVFQGRLFLDSEMRIPPISISSIFGDSRERSPWHDARPGTADS